MKLCLCFPPMDLLPYPGKGDVGDVTEQFTSVLGQPLAKESFRYINSYRSCKSNWNFCRTRRKLDRVSRMMRTDVLFVSSRQVLIVHAPCVIGFWAQ